jgi:GT2 family glycosyltransferase
MKKIGIVIPVFNRLSFTQDCLRMFEEQKKSNFFTNNEIHIIVIDDGSTDGTSEWIAKNYPEVIVLKGDGNLWFSGAVNKGAKYSFEKYNCEYILLWETDIFPTDNYFNDLQDIMEKAGTNVIIASKMMVRNQPDVIFGLGGFFNVKTGDKGLIGSMEKDCPKYQKVMEADWFLGQGVLFHKSTFDIVGYLDEEVFPQYHADIDYGLRAKYKGIKTMIYPELIAWNDTEMSGLSHEKDKSFAIFLRSLYSIRSNYNFIKDIKFYNRHTKGISAYRHLFVKYFEYIGGYLKWKLLGWFGLKRNVTTTP